MKKQKHSAITLEQALCIIEEQEKKIRGLELRKDQYDSIMENMSELVERSDANYALTYVNKAMCNFYHCDPEDLLGGNTMKLVNEEDLSPIATVMKDVNADHPHYHFEYRVQRPDGVHIWMESMGRGFYDEEGNIIEYQDVGRDITHFKNLEEELKNEVAKQMVELKKTNNELVKVNLYLQNILGGISEGIVVIDSDGHCEFLNYGPDLLWKDAAEDLKLHFNSLILGKKNNPIKKLLFQEQPITDLEMRCTSNKGEVAFVISGMVFSMEESAKNKGILVLKPLTQVHNMVNRMSGAQAQFRFRDIVTNSMTLQDAIFLAKQASASDCNILIEGESGTGKELFAQSIHNASNRKHGPFVAVNCGAIPRELVASELFGYTEGAFTGAKKGGKPGKFELAAGGTLFLDEIGDMPMEQQISLLRVIQERSVTRVGGVREIPVDVRIICATNRNLLNEVIDKNFRDDLYYRLNVINFHIPPLRQRKEDILLLFSSFLTGKYPSEEFLERIDPKVLDALVRYDWPGNVRELQNIAERMLYLSDGKAICSQYLPQHILEYEPLIENTPTITRDTSLEKNITLNLSEIRKQNKTKKQELEANKLFTALQNANGNVTKAAKALGISRATLYRKLQDRKNKSVLE